MLRNENRQGKGVKLPAKEHFLFIVLIINQDLDAVAVNNYRGRPTLMPWRQSHLYLGEHGDYFTRKLLDAGEALEFVFAKPG
ncbi:MAG: hypothetical protein WBQ36_12885 [Desulfobaccales bacterium]